MTKGCEANSRFGFMHKICKLRRKIMNYKLITMVSLVILGFCARATTLFFAGDSTLHSRKYISTDDTADTRCLGSWCDEIENVVHAHVNVVNLAYSGTSTKSFIDEGRWAELLSCVQAGDWVYIQFGHNDQKDNDLRRYAPAAGAYTENLKRFVADVRARHAYPVLGTPMARRFFRKDDPNRVQDGLHEYPDVVRRLGRELNVQVVDMNAFSRELIETTAKDETLTWFRAYVEGTDMTHPTVKGAKIIAKKFIEKVKGSGTDFAKLFRSDYENIITAQNVTDAWLETSAGECWQLDWAWREREVPLTANLQPKLEAFDKDGKSVFCQNVGRRQQRVFDPKDLSVQKWRVYASVARADGVKLPDPHYSLARVTLPSSTQKIRLSVSRSGDRVNICDVRMGGVKLSSIPSQPHHHYPKIDDSAQQVLTDEELDTVLAARKKCYPKIVRRGDRSELLVNGCVILPRIWKTTPHDCPARLPAIGQSSDKGFDVMLVCFAPNSCKAEPGDSGGIWRIDGSVDSGKVQRELRRYLKRAPNAMLMLCLSMTPPPGWAENHPSEIYRNELGKFGIFTNCRITDFRDTIVYDAKKNESPAFSYTSTQFAQDGASFLEKLFAAIEEMPEGKAVIGIYCCGGSDGQWLDEFDNYVPGRQAADYSDCAKAGFARFRRIKYGRDDIEVRVPSAKEFWDESRQHYAIGRSTLMSDWCEFLSRSTTEMRLAFARGIKKGSKGRVLVGGYSPNSGIAGYPLISQTYSKGLYESPYYDFFAAVPSYEREHADPVIAAIFDGSCLNRNKLYVSELDLRTPDVCNWGFWGNEFWVENHDVSTFRRKALCFAMNAVTHGGAYHAYDMDGGWYATEAAQATWKRVNEICGMAHAMPMSNERIAFVGGERYWDFQSFATGRVFSYMLRELPRTALSFCGVPFNSYLVDEVLDNLNAELPKVVIFGDLSTISFEQYQSLRDRFARDGRVIVWQWRPGYFTPDGKKIEADLGIKENAKAFGKLPATGGRIVDALLFGVRGTVMAQLPYYGLEFAPVCETDEKRGWKPLVYFRGEEDIPALSVKRGTDCVEVYASLPGGITPQLCRNLVREAKLAPLVETNEISGYGSGFFYIVAQSDGYKSFRLPYGVKPGRVLEGPSFSQRGNGYQTYMKRGQIFILSVK